MPAAAMPTMAEVTAKVLRRRNHRRSVVLRAGNETGSREPFGPVSEDGKDFMGGDPRDMECAGECWFDRIIQLVSDTYLHHNRITENAKKQARPEEAKGWE